MKRKYALSLHSLGCKLNQAETEWLGRRLAESDFTLTSSDRADILILNTCTVTHGADRKSRHMVRMLRKNNPEALIAVTGCYVERAAAQLYDCGADMVVGNEQKMMLPQILVERLSEAPLRVNQGIEVKPHSRVRSFIKIQDGCHSYCSYCIVPLVRRLVYCVPVESVLEEIKERVAEGYKEVVLTGTEIGSYSYQQIGLKGLVERILTETSIERVHLSSLQPQEITADLVALWQDDRLCRHFHIPLQSGSDPVLQRMQRYYVTGDYFNVVNLIRNSFPDASITTDVMVGFPGESDAEFEASYDSCRKIEFAAIHVFTYSPRPGTKAARFPGRVSDRVKKVRSLRMLELAARSTEGFSQRFIGQVRDVLWENEVKIGSGIYSGLTDNYIRVYTRSNTDLVNHVLKAKLTATANSMDKSLLKASTKGNIGEMWGELIE